jgi:hypothetical protein
MLGALLPYITMCHHDIEFNSEQWKEIFLFSTMSRQALKPTHSLVYLLPRVLSHVVNRPGREADDSPPYSPEVKNGGTITLLPDTPSRRGA